MVSTLQKLAKKFHPLRDLSILKMFDTYIQTQWVTNATCIILPRGKAISSAKNLSGPANFTNSSASNNLIGIEIHNPNIVYFFVSSTLVATTNTLKVFTGGLLAIDVALE